MLTVDAETKDEAIAASVGSARSHKDEFETSYKEGLDAESEAVKELFDKLYRLKVECPESAEVFCERVKDIAQRAGELGNEGEADHASLSQQQLDLVIRSHGLSNNCAQLVEGSDLQVMAPLMVECVLNDALELGFQLSDAYLDYLHRVAELQFLQRFEERWERQDHNDEDEKEEHEGGRDPEPLLDPDSDWKTLLDIWNELLAPYPWTKVRPKVMSRVLKLASLQEPLTEHTQLVRSYEILRCLGGDLLDRQGPSQDRMERLQRHGEQYGAWSASELPPESLQKYRAAVAGTLGSQIEYKDPAVMELGYAPSALGGRWLPRMVLGRLCQRLADSISDELEALLSDLSSESLLHSHSELLASAREAEDAGIALAEESEVLRDFLCAVARDYTQRCRAHGSTKEVNFSKLPNGYGSKMQLLALEESEEADRGIDEMSLQELEEILCLIVSAAQNLHGSDFIPPRLKELYIKCQSENGPPLHPRDYGYLSVALQNFLEQNKRLCREREQDSLAHCFVRALRVTANAIPNNSGDASLAGAAAQQALALRPQHTAVPVEVDQALKVVACFGPVEQEQDAGCNPLVVHSVPLSLGSEEGEYHVREVGLRMSGSYRPTEGHERKSCMTTMDKTVLCFFQWSPPEEVREDAKSLEEVLQGFTHIRLTFAHSDGMIEEKEVDLQTSQVKANSAWYRVIPSRPRDSVCKKTGYGFRRFVLEVGRGLRLPFPGKLMQYQPGGGVVETADILGQLLALWFSQKHSRNDLAKEVQQYPELLYFASTALINRFDSLADNLRSALQQHWETILHVKDSTAPLSTAQKEARAILLELLVAKPEERTCAVMPAQHLAEVIGCVEQTRHSLTFIAVENFCFESALQTIRRFQASTLTFLVIEITGHISSVQIAELVRQSQGSVRLLFRWYHGLMPSLEMTCSLSQVIIPASLENRWSSEVQPMAYMDSFAVGQAVLGLSSLVVSQPMALSPLAGCSLQGESIEDWGEGFGDLLACDDVDSKKSVAFNWKMNLETARAQKKQLQQWSQQEEQWRKNSDAESPQEVLLIGTGDENFIRRYYEALPSSEGAHCFDLKGYEDGSRQAVESFLRQGHSHRDSSGEVIASRIMVLFAISFVTQSKLQDLVARAYLAGFQVVLVTRSPASCLQTFRVKTRHATRYLHARVLWADAWQPGQNKSEPCYQALRALSLVFGKDVIRSPSYEDARACLESKDLLACVSLLQTGVPRAVAMDVLSGIQLTLLQLSTAELEMVNTTSLAFAAGCLAASFCKRSTLENLSDVWDMSFPEFRSLLPVCRFLDQVNALEAWCRYLCFQGSTTANQEGPMLPEVDIAWPMQYPEEHFILSQWAVTTNVHASGLEELLEHAMPLPVGMPRAVLPEPSYHGTGPGQLAETREEVLERRCMLGKELDWALFSEAWQTALDIKADLFLLLCASGYDALRLFLCLPPERAVEMGITHLISTDAEQRPAGGSADIVKMRASLVISKLVSHIECCLPMLEAVAEEKSAALVTSRLAALHWLLLTVFPESASASISHHRLNGAVIEELAKAKVALYPRGNSHILERVAASLLSLDCGDVLAMQHDMRRFLLDMKMPLKDLTAIVDHRVGKSLVCFLFSPDHIAQLKSLERGRLLVQGFQKMLGYDVHHWCPLADNTGSEPHLISPAGHACILERAPSQEVVRELALGPLRCAIRNLKEMEGVKAADEFVSRILEVLPDTIVLVIMDAWSEDGEDEGLEECVLVEMSQCDANEESSLPLSSSSNLFLPILAADFLANNVEGYVSVVMRGHGRALPSGGRPIRLMMQEVPRLQELYLSCFRELPEDKSTGHKALHVHETLLDTASCTGIFCTLAAESQAATPSDLFLLWYCWSFSPDRQLPFWAMPHDNFELFEIAVNSGVPFHARCRDIDCGLSLFAKYLVCPEALPISVYNLLSHKAPLAHGHESSEIPVQVVLVGQEGCQEYPPYCLHSHTRILPSKLRQRLLRTFHASFVMQDGLSALPLSHAFFPRVKSGINEQIFKKNFHLLLALQQDNPDLKSFFSNGTNHQRTFIAAYLMVWFKAAGFSWDDLSNCVQVQCRKEFRELLDWLIAGVQGKNSLEIRGFPVRGALPTSMEVRWVEPGLTDVPLFSRTRESSQLSAQWLNVLVAHFGLEEAAYTPEDLVTIEGLTGRGSAGPRFQHALQAVAAKVGAAIARSLRDPNESDLVVELSDDKFDNMNLAKKVALLADFLSMLRSDLKNLSDFVQGMAHALAVNNEGGKRLSDLHSAAVFDTFFMKFGVDPDNLGVEVEAFTDAFHKEGLPVPASNIEEVRWLHENYFGSKSKSSGDVTAKVAAFDEVCERCDRIRKKGCRTVSWRRQILKLPLIGDLLGNTPVAEAPYLRQLHFRLLCDQHAMTQATDVPEGKDLTQSGSTEEFFTLSGKKELHGVRSHSSWQRSWDRPQVSGALSVGVRCPVVAVPDMLEISAPDSSYLYATLRLRPGFHPVLWDVDAANGQYKLATLSHGSGVSSERIRKVFATNAEAWGYLDCMHALVLTCDGFYLRKTPDGGSWLVLLASAKLKAEQQKMSEVSTMKLRQRRCCLWPLCHSHKLFGIQFDTDALAVMQLIVTVAWHCSQGDEAAGTLDALTTDTLTQEVVQPLRKLSVLTNSVESEVSARVVPEADDDLVQEATRLHSYQTKEKAICEVLMRILSKIRTQKYDDLGQIIQQECQRRSESLKVPFILPKTGGLAPLGSVLKRLLVPVASKAGIVGYSETTKAWTQLTLALENCYRMDVLNKERCFEKHMQITKTSFAAKGGEIMQRICLYEQEVHHSPTVQYFSDSEEEEEADEEAVKEEASTFRRHFQAPKQLSYVDSVIDDTVGAPLFDEDAPGYGRVLRSHNSVVTFYDDDVPLYMVPVDVARLKTEYSPADGLCLGYLIHKTVLAEVLRSIKKSDSSDWIQLAHSLRGKFLAWLADVLRSPLSAASKAWILRCCEVNGMVAVPPAQEARQVNLAVIAHCVCASCPSGTPETLFLRSVLTKAWHVPAGAHHFIERKSDMYGVYIVKSGTLHSMKKLGLNVVVQNFGWEVWQRCTDNTAMYLEIISKFSSHCCFLYVTGLHKVDDILLKWFAEYTRAHPWRFIMLEGVDTSFNFPENRDRCNFRFAPKNPLHAVTALADLQAPEVVEMRPSHTVPYPASMHPTAEHTLSARNLFSFFSSAFAGNSTESGVSRKGGSWRAAAAGPLMTLPPAPSMLSLDFQYELERCLTTADPSLTLLVSAPGAGKTYFMASLRARLESERIFQIHELDGSSDTLVTTALAEVLQRAMSSSRSERTKKLLILDEYHMLTDDHKDELFDWVRSQISLSVSVVLIANRIDSKDKQRLEECRHGTTAKVSLIQARLSRTKVTEVMYVRGTSQRWREAISDWLLACRLVFGEEAVSLRLIDATEDALQNEDPRAALVDLLLHRVPTISCITANEFVLAFLRHAGIQTTAEGTAASSMSLTSLCFEVAMLDRKSDELCSFTEFLDRMPRAYETMPHVRLLAWCIYALAAKGQLDGTNIGRAWSKRHIFVDQVNFPFELADDGAGSSVLDGPAFSWPGDPSSMKDLVDAVKRGHSVDWAMVHKQVWKLENIRDSELFAQLLSSSRTPSRILQHVTAANLCSLLRLSNTPTGTAVQLARIILEHASSIQRGFVDHPAGLAMWTLILHDAQITRMGDLFTLAGGLSTVIDSLVWAREWATDRKVTLAPSERAALLQHLLVLVTMQQEISIEADIVLLWTGSFGPLLSAPTRDQVSEWAGSLPRGSETPDSLLTASQLLQHALPSALPVYRLRDVLYQVQDVQGSWPLEIQFLWRVLHQRASSREVNAVWCKKPHLFQCYGEGSMYSETNETAIHEKVLSSIIKAPGSLQRSLQRAILCNNCFIPADVTASALMSACSDALNELRNSEQLRTAVNGSGEAMESILSQLQEDAREAPTTEAYDSTEATRSEAPEAEIPHIEF